MLIYILVTFNWINLASTVITLILLGIPTLGIVMKHATYVHAQQEMEHFLVEQVENIAVDRDYVRRIVM